MDTTWRAVIWPQFGAAIDMLENAVRDCPDALWSDRTRRPEYWYLAFHTLFWLDLYLSEAVEGFTPPAPYTLDELDPAGLFPERPYTQTELLTYLAHCRRKCRAVMEALTEEKARQPCRYGWGETTYGEALLYNMRHVQHHTAQLNLILRQQLDFAPAWVTRTRNE